MNIFDNDDDCEESKSKLEIMNILKKYKINENVLESVTKELLPLTIQNKNIMKIKEDINNYLELFIPKFDNKNYKYEFIKKYTNEESLKDKNIFDIDKIGKVSDNIICYSCEIPNFKELENRKKHFVNKKFIKLEIDKDVNTIRMKFDKTILEKYLENLGKAIKNYGKEFYIKINGYKTHGRYIVLILKNCEIYEKDELNEKYKNCEIVNKGNKNSKEDVMYMMDDTITFSDKYILNPFDCENVYYESIKWNYVSETNFGVKTTYSGKFISKYNINLSEEAKEGLNMISIIDPTNYY